MQVIGFTTWNDRHNNDTSESAKQIVIEYLRERGLAYGGTFHQQSHGVPMFDNGRVYQVSMRDWGELIADMVRDHDRMAYCKYAWEYALPTLGAVPSHFKERVYDSIDAYRLGYMDTSGEVDRPKAVSEVRSLPILVVIDMQPDFLTGPLGNKECKAVIPFVNSLIVDNEWAGIIATRDTHWCNYRETLEGIKLPVEHCMLGTDGWQLESSVMRSLEMAKSTRYAVCNKNTFGCVDLPRTVASIAVRNNKTQEDMEIHMCGVCTSICVMTNAALLRTHFPNAKIVIHKMATADVSPEMKEHALAVLQSIQCDIDD